MTEAQPTVSVIVPTFGRPDALAACVVALRQMDYPSDRFEILVVDDGSPIPVQIPPGPARPRVHLIRQVNQGPAVARNRAAAAATGDVLAFTDDDCRPHPSWLRALVDALDEHPDALLGGDTRNGLIANRWAEASQTLVSFLYGSFGSCRALRPFFTSNNLAGRREVFMDLGGFDESFRHSAAEDRDLSERWSQRGTLLFVPDAHVEHHHALDARGFFKQHHMYGRGAVHLARQRRLRGEGSPVPEPLSFYWRMFTYPMRERGIRRGATLAALIVAAQVAGLTGMLTEVLRRRSTETAF